MQASSSATYSNAKAVFSRQKPSNDASSGCGASSMSSCGQLFASLDTPAVILQTHQGNMLYSPPGIACETMDSVAAHGGGQLVGQLELGDFIHKDFKQASLAQLNRGREQGPRNPEPCNNVFCGGMVSNKYEGAVVTAASRCSADREAATRQKVAQRQDNQIITQPLLHILSGRNISDGPQGMAPGKATAVNVKTNAGLKPVDIAEYTRVLLATEPQMVVSIADELSLSHTSKNRTAKAAEKTQLMFTALQKNINESNAIAAGATTIDEGSRPPLLFAVAVGGAAPGATAKSATWLLEAGAQALSVGGANMGETDEAFVQAMQEVRDATREHSNAVPVLVEGCNTPLRLLLALENGADLVSSDLPSRLTELGWAMQLDVVTPWGQQTGAAAAAIGADDDAEVTGGVAKRRRPSELQPLALDMWDTKWARDKNPLQDGCMCHACRHHTRSYIHHLLLCRELLAEVLLYQHNQYQLLQLLQGVRRHVNDGTLSRFVQHLRDTIQLDDSNWEAVKAARKAKATDRNLQQD